MRWRWISITALLAALVVGYGALVGHDDEPVANDEPPEQPGYYLKDAVINRTREDGSPGIEFIARRIQQQVPTQPGHGVDRITMEDVRVNYFGDNDWKWSLSAERGEVPANSRIVHLQGNVELKPLDNESKASLRTDELAIDTEKNVAYSTRPPVRLRYGQHAMTVRSLRADLRTEKIRLESVNGRFDPQ